MISRTNTHRLLVASALLSFIFAIVYSFVTGSWVLFLSMAFYFQILKIIGNHIAMHRFYSHRSFKTGFLREKFLAFSSILLSANSPLAYAIVHRHHHKYSDTDKDLHSPHNNGFFTVLFGLWEFKDTKYFSDKGCTVGLRDLMRNKDLIFIDKHYYKIWALLIIITMIISWKLTIFFLLAPAGYFHIAAGMINSMGHWKMWGSYRNHDCNDNSYNNWFLGMYSCGEGFHNNHHQNQSSYDFGHKWFEIDIAAIVIKLFFDKDYYLLKKS